MLSNFNTKAHPLALFWIHYQVPTKVHTNFRSAVHIFSFQLPGLSWFICQVRGLWGYWTVTTRGGSGCVGIWRWLYMFIDADQYSRVVHKQTRAVFEVCTRNRSGRLEMFYLTMHSTHFILQLYGVGHLVKDRSDSERGNLLSLHGLLFLISSKGYAPSHRQNTTLYGLLYQRDLKQVRLLAF